MDASEVVEIKFGIEATCAWDATTNTMAAEPCRSADVCVFALLAHNVKASLDPLDLTQWQFYVVSRRTLDEIFGVQKSIALSSLTRVASHPVSFADLCSAVATAAQI